ncbi:MAG: hypothetical protein KDK36_01245, partial [Leptospiraceae bacterium]|nr:hypothetical protein [Leptospiraceae bacterium]
KKAEIELINYKTGKVVFSLNLKKKKSEYIDLEAISVSEEKNEFSYYLNGFIYTHNLTTGKEIKKKKTEESFISCSYSPCGKYIFYSNGNGKIFRYDSKDLNIFKTAQKHNEGISSFVFNKSIMLTTGKESNGFFWDFDSLECLGNFTNTSGGVCPGTFYSEEEFCIGGSGAVVQFFKVTSKF